MKQQHHPYDIKLFSKGANYDINKEFLSGDQGSYIDACNFRPSDMSGDNSAAKKIKGETLFYSADDSLPPCADAIGAVDMTSDHICIGALEVNNKIIEFWAYEPKFDGDVIDSQFKYPVIKINGVIVAQSEKIPFTYNNVLQLDKNEACVGGEVYVTDNVYPPMFFNVEDMENNAGINDISDCTTKYFASFDPELYKISISTTINAPRFLEYLTTNAGSYDASNAGNGLDVGTYAYAVRFVDSEGNRTEISEFTPTIPAYKNISDKTGIHPFAYTYGSDTGQTTTLGFSLSIRGNQTKGFASCEVIRVSWNAGDPTLLDIKPAAFVVARFDLEEDSIRNYTVLDRSMDILEAVSDEEATLIQTNISRAKAVRFFNNRLYLMNVSVEGRDIDVDTVGTGADNLVNAYPVMSHMFLAGHNDPWQYAYRKQYMNIERYGYGAVFRDSNGSRTFTTPLKFDQGAGVKDFFEFPSKREAMSDESKNLSFTGAQYGTNNDNNIGYTYDCYANLLRETRSSRCAWQSYLTEGRKCSNKVFGGGQGNPDAEWEEDNCFTGYGSNFFGVDVCITFKTKELYQVLKPQQLSDINEADTGNGHYYKPNRKVYHDANEYGFIWDDAHMFANDFYAMGLGIEKIVPPSWATSFSIVRTKAAFRVLAEGLAFYSLDSGYNLKTNTQKDRNKVTFYSADIDSSKGLYSNFATDVESSSSLEYKLVLQAPVGFNSELYHGNKSAGKDKAWDLISFAYMQKDQKRIGGTKWYLPYDESTEPLSDSTFRYVAFGRWRNPVTYDGDTKVSDVWTQNKKTFNIKSFQYVSGAGTIAGERGGHYWTVELDDNIYRNKFVNNERIFNDELVKAFHEPFYIASIIKDDNEPDQGQVISYLSTGHIQHIKSPFYLSKGIPFEQNLVDERWEDCISDIVYDNNGNYTEGSRISGQTVLYHTYRRFVYQERLNQQEERAWLDVTREDQATIIDILDEISANGFALVDDRTTGFPQTVRVYGVYSHKWDGQYYKNQKPSLIFDESTLVDKGISPSEYSNNLYVPEAGSTIFIKYDDRIPITVYGGDSYSSEATFGYMDIKYTSKGNPDPNNEEFQLTVGMPHHKYEINPRNIIVNDTTGIVNNIQNDNETKIGNSPAYLRQWVIMYISHSRTPLHSQYMNPTEKNSLLQFYPLVHYRPRPNKWKTDDPIGEQRNVFEEYYEELGNEDEYWNWGGFRFLSSVNQDYAAENRFHEYTSKPFFIEEETDFCTRIIWSDIKPINVQDSPNVRSFNALNYFDISDDTGEIKYAFDTEGEKGSNLYAITESGVCVLITDQRILSQLTGEQLAIIGSEEQGVQKQIWLKKNIGMPDEMWRSAGESSNALYWANKDTVYKLFNNEVVDIGRAFKYHGRLNPELQLIKDGFETKLTGTFNMFHKEYWLNIKCDTDDSFIDVELDYIPTRPTWLVDTEINGGLNFTEDRPHLLGVNDGENLLISTEDTELIIYLGGNLSLNGAWLSAKSFKICIDQDSQPIVINDPKTDESFTMQPNTCKCFSAVNNEGDIDYNNIITE